MLRAAITFLLITSCLLQSYGQNGFNGSFRFLQTPSHSLLAGIGGKNISLNEMDINMMSSNPSLVSEQLDKHLSLSYILFPGDIHVSNVSYLTKVGSTGVWGANLTYFDYGTMQGFDATGAQTGEFSAGEYAITLNRSHQIGNYRLGASMKFAYSGIAGYSSTAIIADFGGVFIHPERDFTAALVVKNAGLVIADYTDHTNSNTTIPFDVQAGTSFKPQHMPVRFSFTVYDLTNWDNFVIEEGESDLEEPSGIDKFFRHTVFGAQFLIGKNLELLFGYDHKKRKELKLTGPSGSTGFTYGINIGIQTFKIGFSRQGYYKGGVSNVFSLTSDLGRWIKKKSITE